MAIVQTGLANTIEASANKIRLDKVAKRLVKHKVICAGILKECVEAFREYNVSYIEKYCIKGEADLGKIPVDQGMVDSDSRFIGSDTEDGSNEEKTVHYDIVFCAMVPYRLPARRCCR